MDSTLVQLPPTERALPCLRTLHGVGVALSQTAAGNAVEARCGCGHTVVALTAERAFDAFNDHLAFLSHQ